jgi:hypothetical protein
MFHVILVVEVGFSFMFPVLIRGLMKKDNTKLSEMLDRQTISPCKTCYKRDSCFIKPFEGQCVGYEAGTPWTETYNATLPV